MFTAFQSPATNIASITQSSECGLQAVDTPRRPEGRTTNLHNPRLLRSYFHHRQRSGTAPRLKYISNVQTPHRDSISLDLRPIGPVRNRKIAIPAVASKIANTQQTGRRKSI